MAAIGDTFLLPKPGDDIEHLWVLITAADPTTHNAIMLNVTTRRPHSDSTTVLNPGDHPFVHKPSVIFYADARIVDVRLLDQLVKQGSFKSHAPFDRGVLTRIQNGVQQSRFTPNKIKTAFADAAKAGLI